MAAGALVLWRTRWVREERRHRRDPMHEGIALGCALVLLFFAVSLSDDLHAEVLVFDECLTSRRQTASAHHSPIPGKNVERAGPAVLPRVTPKESPRELYGVIPAVEASVPILSLDLPAGRSPPA